MEKWNGSRIIVQCNSREGELHMKQENTTFIFDKVYGPESRQIYVYQGVVEPMIEEVLMGYNCTMFA